MIKKEKIDCVGVESKSNADDAVESKSSESKSKLHSGGCLRNTFFCFLFSYWLLFFVLLLVVVQIHPMKMEEEMTVDTANMVIITELDTIMVEENMAELVDPVVDMTDMTNMTNITNITNMTNMTDLVDPVAELVDQAADMQNVIMGADITIKICRTCMGAHTANMADMVRIQAVKEDILMERMLDILHTLPEIRDLC